MDYGAICSQMVAAARGQRSAASLSTALAMSSNAVWSWEDGRRAPRASAMFAFLEASGINVRARLARLFVPAVPRWVERWRAGDPFPTVSLLEHIKGTDTAREFAARVGFDRFVAARWLCAETEPTFPKLLQIVDRGWARLVDFVDTLIPADRIPQLAERARATELLRELAYESPASEAVIRVIEGRGFAVDDVAAALPMVEADEVKRITGRLLAAGIVDVDRTGTLSLRYSLSIHTGKDPKRAERVRKYWTHTMADLASGPRDVHSYVIFQADEQELAELARLTREYYATVRRRLREFRGSSYVAGVSVQVAQISDRRDGKLSGRR